MTNKYERIKKLVSVLQNNLCRKQMQVTDKAAVADDYAKLQAAVNAYNEYVTTANDEVTTANDVATKVFVTAGGVTAVLACVYVAIKKLLGGAL